MKIRTGVLTVGLMLATAVPASAQSFLEYLQPYRPREKGQSDTYVVTISGTGQIEPRFPGSDKASGVFYPSLSYRRSDEAPRFAAVDDGISIPIIDDPAFRLGPVFRLDNGRYRSDDRRELFGLRKLNYDIESGGFVELWPADVFRLRAELRHGFRDDAGFTGTIGADVILPYGRFVFSAGPRYYLGDDKYVNRFFGVTPGEAALNGLVTPFRPKGGAVAAGALAALTYRFSDTFASTVFVDYRKLVGDAGASPISNRIGSPDQVIVGLKLSYSFDYQSGR